MIRAVAVHALTMIFGTFVAGLALSAALSALPGFNEGANPNVRIVPVMDANAHHLDPSQALR